MLEKFRTAVFDCDGVLLDFTEAKMDAFVQALEGEARWAVDQFVAYQRRNWGVSRYKSLNWFYSDVVKAPDAPAKAKAAIARFAKMSRQALLTCPELPGTRDLLVYLQQKAIPAFVVTGGDEAEVSAVFQARGLLGYFQKICGSPRTKLDNLGMLLADGAIALPAFFVGDARADFEAAQGCGLDFILATEKSDWVEGPQICRDAGITVVDNLSRLLMAEKAGTS